MKLARVLGITLFVGEHTLLEKWGIRPADVDPLAAVTYSDPLREIEIPNGSVRRLELAGLLRVSWSADDKTWTWCGPTPEAFTFLSELRSVRALPSGLLNPHACT